jgi:3-hydroxyisobutyrate dehydrogenase
MAGHLARAGHSVTVYNRSASKGAGWVQEYGGRSASHTARGRRKDADIVLCLRGQRRRPALGGAWATDGAFAGMAAGALLVDHTTASAEVARELARGGQRAGLWFRRCARLRRTGRRGQRPADRDVRRRGQPPSRPCKPGRPWRFARRHPDGPFRAPVSWPRWSTRSASPGWCKAVSEGIAFRSEGRPGHEGSCSRSSARAQRRAGRWTTAARPWSGRPVRVWLCRRLDAQRPRFGAWTRRKRNGARLPVTALVDQFYADVQAMGGQRWDTSSLIKRLR